MYRSIHFEKIKKPHSCFLRMLEDNKQPVYQALRLMEFICMGRGGGWQGRGFFWSPAACRDQATEAWLSSGATLLYMVTLEHQRVLCTGLKNKRGD